jgi:D-amino-acid dehydrogenase/Ca-activated chloride channel family protein
MFQTDARVEIEATRTEQAVEIMDERVKWRLLTQDERLYMVDLVKYLNDIDKVAPVHTIEIWDILLERQQAAYDIGEEVYDELYNANEENREQMREKIDELVNEKTE